MCFSFGPTDTKFATASDDGTVRVWDFHRCLEERILRGHGSDVKQVPLIQELCILRYLSIYNSMKISIILQLHFLIL